MIGDVRKQLDGELDAMREAGTYKSERVLSTPQGAHVGITGREGDQIVNICANDYLGLANHPEIVAAARDALDRWGFGVASVRFICGTQQLHKDLEAALTTFLQTEDTILYPSCFDANGGLFETLLTEEDAVISDALNHASIIDGIRLTKARRLRYANGDMDELERCLKESAGARRTLIATDGVFSMDGLIANLSAICDLAERYGAMVMVDDSHGVGVLGARGRGTPEHHGVIDRIDILTGTLGKALGGGGGGYTSGRREIVELMRQRSRPYLFSNSITPAVAGASLRAIELLSASTELRDRLVKNTTLFRELVAASGLTFLPGEHPIVPIMISEERLLKPITDGVFEAGLHVAGFSYPVVPMGKARIRTQVSAAHSEDDLRFAVSTLSRVAAAN
ncbi:MAG: glycine C-acetyltransferase [Actinomycetota bacterium]|jgi:glycine C-acetyltransferase|nr:glycine C-acetyltransferase [Actinomycetota bacterium]